MRCLRLVVLVAVAGWSSACFQMTTVLKVRGDGAGTIEHRMVYTAAALEKLRQFATLGGGRGGAIDPLSEQQAREIGGAHGRRIADLQRLMDTIDAVTGRRRLRRRAFATLSAVIAAGLVNAGVRADSLGAALVVLILALGLTLMAWRTYGAMARDRMKGRWTALAAVILSSAMTLGSLIRLVVKGL